MERWSLRIFKRFLYIHSPNPDVELKIFFVKMVMEWWMFMFSLGRNFLDGVFFWDSYTRSSNCSVYDGRCTHTHLSHAHFSAHSVLCAYFTTSSCVSHTHAWLKCSQLGSLHMCHTSASRLLPPSWFTFLFLPHGIHTILPYFLVLKVQDMRHSAPASRSLATWPSQMQTQVMSPRSSTRPLLQTATRRPSTVRTTIAPVTSRIPHARTLDCSVFPQCLKPLFRTFLMEILLFREKAKKACLGKPLQDREKEKVLWSVLQSRVKEKSTEQY